ncbi:hypothetical protein ACFIJ5_16915 [Haloimpatiens sp. FM7330]|uniref:hypothetical protein n=1 Tax=Haloimpatiens sp. FM7330 TaxID=3298610 RepID=UPI003635AF03
MKKIIKYIVICVLILGVVGFYYKKNIYTKKDSNTIENQQQTHTKSAGMPQLLELGTDT